jgi:hypothetical protein
MTAILLGDHPILRKPKVFDAENACDYDYRVYRGPDCTYIFNAEQKLCYPIEAKDGNFSVKCCGECPIIESRHCL